MTSPTLATTFDWGRMYARVRGGTPEVPSITTILDVLDQDLEWWEALCAVRLAMDHAPKLAEVHQMPNGPEKWSRERAAKDWLVAAAERDRNESAERGDFVHNYAEVFGLYSAGMATSADLAEQERLCKQAEVMDYLPHVHRFWETWQPRVLRAEATVWSEQARYAGTTDLIFEIDLDGKTYCVVGDYKCTTDDTEVLLSNGTQRRAADLSEGDLVLAWDADAGDFKPRAVSWVGDNGMQPTVVIAAAGGRSVQVTRNHPVLVRRFDRPPGRSGRRALPDQWVLAADVLPGDLVRTDVRPAAEMPSTMTDDDAYLLGALIGDGGLSQRTYRFSKREERVVQRVSRCLAAHGLELRQSPSMKGSGDYYLADASRSGHDGGHPSRLSEFRGWLSRLGLDGVLASDKHIPAEVMGASVSARRAFISGYLDTDGYVRDPERFKPLILWNSASERLVRQVRDLLASLGVLGHVVPSSVVDGKQYWRCSISSARATFALAEQVESLVPSREARLALLRKAQPTTRADDYGWVRVSAVEDGGVVHTVALEIEGLHTHVTGGLVTHNTKKALFKRNGEEKADLRLYTSMQLAAVVHAEEMWVEGETPWDDEWVRFPYKIDMGVGIAIGPDGYAVRQYDVHSPLVWDTFTSLRRAWEFRRVNRVAPESLMTKRLAGPHELILPGRPYPTESA